MCRVLRVRGESLSPAIGQGDFVFISKIPLLFSAPRAGDIIAFRHPQWGILIKRVERALPGALFVVGSHPDSVDSRSFGPVAPEAVLGKMIAHVRKR